MIVYSRPPYPDINYPYIIVNVFDETSFNYIKPKSVKSVIIDSGVHTIFHRYGLNEYPGGYKAWIAKVVRWYSFAKTLVDDVYAVVPDYPSDYENNPINDNVERTIRNIEYAISTYPNVKWIIPIQGKKDDVISVVRTLDHVVDMGVLKSHNYIAIGPTCSTRNVPFLKEIAALVLMRVKRIEKNGQRIRIHMFGTSMKSWKYIAPYIDSTDTIVTNYWCLPLINKMCTKREEKEMAWQIFLQRATEMLNIERK
ncbi:MAG: hypothetical protein JHC26_12710 [Thermofilum sp.]|jgi:hypothetical protein|uniref:hypothetical protein n=1 Tax=Thermofilum sp. TaxID=1961369 RepID=UPI0025890EC6|nr:hypothetical protein [Thermofilum sp.]MCI4409947.1 hypothetical protein [Thermofilum sp.]